MLIIATKKISIKKKCDDMLFITETNLNILKKDVLNNKTFLC